MNPTSQNPSGLLLRMERVRQNKGQKEICHGICTVSYLSKIERGQANPEPSLLALLFARLGIVYETDSCLIAENQARLSHYFSSIRYGLVPEADVTCLKALKKRLLWSPLALDYLLFFCLDERRPLSQNAVPFDASSSGSQAAVGSKATVFTESEAPDSIDQLLAVLEKLTGHMSREQYAYYCLILMPEEPDNQTCFTLCQHASEGLSNSLGFRSLLHGYYTTQQYHIVHQLEPKLTINASAACCKIPAGGAVFPMISIITWAPLI